MLLVPALLLLGSPVVDDVETLRARIERSENLEERIGYLRAIVELHTEENSVEITGVLAEYLDHKSRLLQAGAIRALALDVHRETALQALLDYVPGYLEYDAEIQEKLANRYLKSEKGYDPLDQFESDGQTSLLLGETLTGIGPIRDSLIHSLSFYGEDECLIALGQMLAQVRVSPELEPAFQAMLKAGTATSIDTAITFLERCEEHLEWREDSISDIKKCMKSSAPDWFKGNRSEWKELRGKHVDYALNHWNGLIASDEEWLEGLHTQLVAFVEANLDSSRPPRKFDTRAWRRWAKKYLEELPASSNEGD